MKFYKLDDSDDLFLKVFTKDALNESPAGMTEVKVGTVDAALEKHVPYVTREGDVLKVQIGEVEHPMLDVHWITFVVAEKTNGFELIELHPGDAPIVEFNAKGVIAIYEYCNLHGLWKADVK